MTRLRSEIMAEAWRARYVRGEIEADEMEAGIGRALRGEATDAEWLMAAHEETLRQFQEPITGLFHTPTYIYAGNGR